MKPEIFFYTLVITFKKLPTTKSLTIFSNNIVTSLHRHILRDYSRILDLWIRVPFYGLLPNAKISDEVQSAAG